MNKPKPTLCTDKYTCSFACIDSITNTPVDRTFYDTSLGISPLHQINLLTKCGYYALPVHPLAMDTLSPALYLVNNILPNGVPHTSLLLIDIDFTDFTYSVMDPRYATWRDASPMDLPKLLPNITSILRIHDCNEPLYDIISKEELTTSDYLIYPKH